MRLDTAVPEVLKVILPLVHPLPASFLWARKKRGTYSWKSCCPLPHAGTVAFSGEESRTRLRVREALGRGAGV